MLIPLSHPSAKLEYEDSLFCARVSKTLNPWLTWFATFVLRRLTLNYNFISAHLNKMYLFSQRDSYENRNSCESVLHSFRGGKGVSHWAIGTRTPHATPSKSLLIWFPYGVNRETKLQTTALSQRKCAFSSFHLAQLMVYPNQITYNLDYLIKKTLHYHDAMILHK